MMTKFSHNMLRKCNQPYQQQIMFVHHTFFMSQVFTIIILTSVKVAAQVNHLFKVHVLLTIHS